MSQKIESVHFYSYPQAKLSLPPPPPSPQVFVIILQSDGNCPFLRFLKIFFSEEKGGEDYGVEKITKINKDIGQKS